MEGSKQLRRLKLLKKMSDMGSKEGYRHKVYKTVGVVTRKVSMVKVNSIFRKIQKYNIHGGIK
ncbi:hypothetical protein KKF70_02960 [bacterium]|nr:hypothetical protein [bacterium]